MLTPLADAEEKIMKNSSPLWAKAVYFAAATILSFFSIVCSFYVVDNGDRDEYDETAADPIGPAVFTFFVQS